MGRQTKTIPINRTVHAALERIHPLPQGNVDFHGGWS
jgi:hypothetical protein